MLGRRYARSADRIGNGASDVDGAEWPRNGSGNWVEMQITQVHHCREDGFPPSPCGRCAGWCLVPSGCRRARALRRWRLSPWSAMSRPTASQSGVTRKPTVYLQIIRSVEDVARLGAESMQGESHEEGLRICRSLIWGVQGKHCADRVYEREPVPPSCTYRAPKHTLPAHRKTSCHGGVGRNRTGGRPPGRLIQLQGARSAGGVLRNRPDGSDRVGLNE